MENYDVLLDNRTSLPLMICVCMSCVVFKLIISRFYSWEWPVFDTSIDLFSYEETFAILNNLGLNFLTVEGSFITVIWLYMTHLGYLTQLVNCNLGSLHPEVLMSILDQLKFLITVHELLFEVIKNLVSMSEHIDLNIGYDQYALEQDIRTAGNNLYTIYRRIERVLNYPPDSFPLHWAEN